MALVENWFEGTGSVLFSISLVIAIVTLLLRNLILWRAKKNYNLIKEDFYLSKTKVSQSLFDTADVIATFSLFGIVGSLTVTSLPFYAFTHGLFLLLLVSTLLSILILLLVLTIDLIGFFRMNSLLNMYTILSWAKQHEINK